MIKVPYVEICEFSKIESFHFEVFWKITLSKVREAIFFIKKIASRVFPLNLMKNCIFQHISRLFSSFPVVFGYTCLLTFLYKWCCRCLHFSSQEVLSPDQGTVILSVCWKMWISKDWKLSFRGVLKKLFCKVTEGIYFIVKITSRVFPFNFMKN